MKLFFGFWFLLIVLTTLVLFFDARPESASQPPPKWTFLGICVLSAAIFYVYWRFKSVFVDERFLYVSDFFKETSIPLSEIRDVTEIRLVRGNPMAIHLKTPCRFGAKIWFLPKSKRLLKYFQPHPLVASIKTLTQGAHSDERAGKIKSNERQE